MASDELACHMESLTRFARSIAHCPLEAEDLVQETFRRVLGYLQDGRSLENPRAYLFAALANLRADRLARSRRCGTPVSLESHHLSLGFGPTQEQHMACGDLVRALAALPAGQREVVRLVALEGMSYQEAAARLGVPLGTIMSRLNRARRSLRSQLGDTAEAA